MIYLGSEEKHFVGWKTDHDMGGGVFGKDNFEKGRFVDREMYLTFITRSSSLIEE